MLNSFAACRCNKVRCTRCNNSMCWLCGLPIDSYDHFGSDTCLLFEGEGNGAYRGALVNRGVHLLNIVPEVSIRGH